MRSLTLSAAACMTALGLLPAGPCAAQAAELPARIRVLLPADATLAIDGAPTRSTSDLRDFVTPPLQVGKVFHYELQVSFVHNGNDMTIVRRVTVRAGQETVARLDLSGDAAPPRGSAVEGVQPPTRTERDFRPVRPRAGGPENNWKPDSSDPFYPWN